MDETTRKGVFLPLQKSRDSSTIQGIHANQDGISICEFRPLEDGKPIMGGLTTLTPRSGTPFLDTEETMFVQNGVGQVATKGHQGPARVNSKEYCLGWDNIFGKTKIVGET